MGYTVAPAVAKYSGGDGSDTDSPSFTMAPSASLVLLSCVSCLYCLLIRPALCPGCSCFHLLYTPTASLPCHDLPLCARPPCCLCSDPDDLTLVSHLMAAVATTLDRCEAARRRRLPFGIGGNKKSKEADRRQTLERVAAQRAALSASRIGLPGFVLVSCFLRVLQLINDCRTAESPVPDCACMHSAWLLPAASVPGQVMEKRLVHCCIAGGLLAFAVGRNTICGDV